MIKPIVDKQVYAKLDEHARYINQRTRHSIELQMRDGLSGYGLCTRLPCTASFHVGYKVNDPARSIIVTDDTTSHPCPYEPSE